MGASAYPHGLSPASQLSRYYHFTRGSGKSRQARIRGGISAPKIKNQDDIFWGAPTYRVTGPRSVTSPICEIVDQAVLTASPKVEGFVCSQLRHVSSPPHRPLRRYIRGHGGSAQLIKARIAAIWHRHFHRPGRIRDDVCTISQVLSDLRRYIGTPVPLGSDRAGRRANVRQYPERPPRCLQLSSNV